MHIFLFSNCVLCEFAFLSGPDVHISSMSGIKGLSQMFCWTQELSTLLSLTKNGGKVYMMPHETMG
jgi:hypothetical protein